MSYRRTDGDTDIIFICNPADTTAAASLEFDFADRFVEVWDPYTCSMHSVVSASPLMLQIEPSGSRFVIVRPERSCCTAAPEMRIASTCDVDGRWTVDFPEIGSVVSDTLFSWPDCNEPAMRYFSGTVTYTGTLALPDSMLPDDDSRLILSLGDVRNMARVKINGRAMPLLWKSPFDCDITEAVIPGDNMIEVDVTNLWPNRMIGDEFEPDDLEWSEPLVYTYAPGSPVAGRYLTSNPDWLVNGTPRPSQGRKTVGCFKFFTRDSSLLPSGLLGPVTLTLLRP